VGETAPAAGSCIPPIVKYAGGGSTGAVRVAASSLKLIGGLRGVQGQEAEANECVRFWTDMMCVPPSLPILAGLPLGHGRRNSVVPLGCAATIDLEHGTLSFADC
jgi:hypothetical protein